MSSVKFKEEIDKYVEEQYEIIDRIGRGKNCIVIKACDKYSNFIVAIKKVYDILNNEVECEKIYKEIRLYEYFSNHPNILKLLNVIKSNNPKDSSVYIVTEFMEANLFDVIRAGILTELHIKNITYSILKALKYIHSAEVIKMNLKPSHILLNNDCKIKLDDFSLAQETNSEGEYSNITDYVASRWYRAPELLLGSYNYQPSIDIWSVGCILGEMINGKTVFPGTCTLNQLNLIIQLTGKPSDDDLIDIKGTLTGLLDNLKYDMDKVRNFNDYFHSTNEEVLDLLKKLLEFNPKKRISAAEALEHVFFIDIKNVDEELKCDLKYKYEVEEELKQEIKQYIHKEINIDIPLSD